MNTKPTSIDEYIAGFPEAIQILLQQIRTTIREAAPEVVETIKYDMPTFMLQGKNFLYFAAFKKHIGLYAIPHNHPNFKEELATYKTGKGSVQLPLNQPMPLDLIGRMVRFKVEDLAKAS